MSESCITNKKRWGLPNWRMFPVAGFILVNIVLVYEYFSKVSPFLIEPIWWWDGVGLVQQQQQHILHQQVRHLATFTPRNEDGRLVMVGCGVVISASPSPGCQALASLDWPQCGLVRRTIITQLQRYHLVPLHLVTDTLLCRVWCQCHTDLELGMGVVLVHLIYNLNLLENHYSDSEQ